MTDSIERLKRESCLPSVGLGTESLDRGAAETLAFHRAKNPIDNTFKKADKPTLHNIQHFACPLALKHAFTAKAILIEERVAPSGLHIPLVNIERWILDSVLAGNRYPLTDYVTGQVQDNNLSAGMAARREIEHITTLALSVPFAKDLMVITEHDMLIALLKTTDYYVNSFVPKDNLQYGQAAMQKYKTLCKDLEQSLVNYGKSLKRNTSSASDNTKYVKASRTPSPLSTPCVMENGVKENGPSYSVASSEMRRLVIDSRLFLQESIAQSLEYLIHGIRDCNVLTILFYTGSVLVQTALLVMCLFLRAAIHVCLPGAYPPMNRFEEAFRGIALLIGAQMLWSKIRTMFLATLYGKVLI